jgi:hypothetical protein
VKIPESRPSERPVINPVNPSPLKTAVNPKVVSPAIDRSGSSITAQSGLPRDSLAASILSFARFFSLPLDQDFVAKIRRLVLRAEQSEKTPIAPRSQNFREALSLAALAAEYKGVELSPRALVEYAAALDPAKNAGPGVDRDQGGRGGGQDGGEGKENGSNTADSAESGAGDGTGTGSRPGSQDGASWSSPAGLKLKLSEVMKKSPLLGLLNSIPGKDGRRWVVLPFSFSSNGILYRVSMRILLCPRSSGTTAEYLTLDIARFDQAENSTGDSIDRQDPGRGTSENRRLFIVNTGNPARLDLRLKPFPGKGLLLSLSRELSELLKIPREQIFIQNFEDFSDFMADSRINILPSINKEV